MIKEGVDGVKLDFDEIFLKPAPTIRGYTPLHIAAWGTAKPQYDRDIVEAILNAAAKAGKDKEAACREATDKVDGETALDLAKQRLAKVDANPPKPGADDKDFLDEKKRLDKMIEWLEKGLPAG